jgi:acyl carrier protein
MDAQSSAGFADERRAGPGRPGEGVTNMNQDQVFEKVVSILKPFVKAPDALARVNMESSIVKDLDVNSARLVDVILEIEDAFGLAIADAEADQVKTIGDAVRLIQARAA